MNVFARFAAVLAAASFVAGCGGGQPVDQSPVAPPMSQAELTQTPPPNTSTPVPIIRATTLAGAGRTDPFVPLFVPSNGAASSGKSVAVSTFPHIPTLPGFEGAPKSGATIWDGIVVTGIVYDGGYTAIVTANGASYIVHTGDYVANRFRVVAIGPDSVTLATNKEERHFSLGG
jgi:hypothetical protein